MLRLTIDHHIKVYTKILWKEMKINTLFVQQCHLFHSNDDALRKIDMTWNYDEIIHTPPTLTP